MTIPYTIPWERDIHTKIHVSRADGYTWEDLLPFTTSVEISSGNVTRFGGRIAGIDGVMPQLDLILRQNPDNKLNPQDQNSIWNKVNGEYSPLLAPMREIAITTAVTLPGVAPSKHDWIGLFHGYLGDGIRIEGDKIRVNCRSLSKRLQDTYVENPKDYGSEEGSPVELVIQEVLDDNLGVGEIELYCPVPTGFMVYPYGAESVQYKTVWDVLQALATAHDFFLGDLWDPVTERMRLTLLVPPRDKDANTADFVLNYRSDFLREEREIRDVAIRNVIIGHYWDKDANEKRTITVKDDASISQFGRRAMEVEEEATSLIQTEAEMLTFLNAILLDLKDQQGTSYLSMPFFPQIGLFSGLVIHHPAMSSTNDFLGVESFRHTLDFAGKQYRTEIVGSGRIRGGQQRWLKSETKPGSPGHPSTPPTSNVPPADVAWGHCSFITDVSLNWEPVRGATSYEIRTEDSNWGYADGIIYRGNGLSHRFTPTQRNYTLYIKAINAAGLYSKQATMITLSLPVPVAPQQPKIDPYFTALQIHVMPLNNPAIVGYYVYLTKDGETEPVKTLVRAGEHLTYSAPSGTTFTVQVTAFDILGEGPISEPMQATTTALTDGDIPDDIVGPSKLTENLRSDIDLSKTQSAEAISLVGGFDDRITATETVLEDASQRLESAETELGAIDGKLTTQETKITNIEGELSSKVSQTDFDTLSGTVSSHGTTLTQHASAIEAKAEKSEVDTIEGRVTTAEGQISTQAGQIALKANASDVYTKTQVNTELGKKADKTAVDGLTTRVTDAELTINAHTGSIAQKAERSEVYTKTETDAKLGTKVDTTTYNQKVGELTTSIDGITGRVSNTETNINNLTGEVSSVKSDVSQLEIKADGIQSTVTSLDAKVDGIEIGGRNLLSNSANIVVGGLSYPEGSRAEFQALNIGSAWVDNCEDGEQVTISFDIEMAKGDYLFVYNSNYPGPYGFRNHTFRNIGVAKTRLSFTTTLSKRSNPTYTYDRLEFYSTYGTSDWYRITNVKLEKGNKATDWTPAPEDVDAEINTVSTQVTQLADRYSVKTQKTSGGKTYATGFVSGINEQNESEFAVLADRFRVFGTTTSDGQAVFAVDTVTKKAYFLADLIVNGLVRATALEAEQLKTHMIQAGYAVFDEANILDLEARKILAAGGAIEIGEEGIMMIPPGYAQRSMHLDGAQLAFWDKNNMPSIAMGDLTQARQNIINAGMTNLFPDGFVNGSNFPQYGFLMMQGNIALARSVLAHSLIEMPADLILDRSIQNRKLAQNAVTSYNVAPKAISLDKLADNIHVPSMNDAQILRASPANIDNAIVRDAVATLRSWTFNKKSGHYSAEQGRLSFDFVVNATASMVGQICFVVDGTTIACVSQYGGDPQNNYEIYVDLRGLSEAGIPMSITGQRIGGGSTRVTVSNIRFYQNNQLPLRIGNPAYAVIGGTPSGCYSGCEVTCESSCQATCQDSCETNCEGTCEKSCMTGCQTSCQATCEKTSQSGGGCIREGTPVDVWAIDTQEYITVPVEDLKRGMILPWYQPETDTVIHGELLELQDASYSNEFLRIRTHNGPSVDVTFSQPFDVLADLGQGQKWYKLQAMYLRPGMQLVRPFDTPDNRLSTIVSVETVREPRVHFWNPKTSTGGFCVNGYADMITK